MNIWQFMDKRPVFSFIVILLTILSIADVLR